MHEIDPFGVQATRAPMGYIHSGEEGDGQALEASGSGDTCVGRLLEGEIGDFLVQKRLVN